jgi:mannose-1-phosphate guanylyltransferase
MTTYAVIMAGGSGTRFWPLSRRMRPKQFLSIGTEESLMQETVKRLIPLVPMENIRIVAGKHHVAAITEHLPNLTADALLIEPCARNTAPCVGLAAIHIAHKNPDAVMAVLPSDHHISDTQGYQRIFETAVEIARTGDIVTLGITPNRPETGYGYIEFNQDDGQARTPKGTQVYTVERFVEKPDKETAEDYLKSKRFLWNSGMFFFTARTILEAINRHLPEIAAGLNIISEAIGRPDYATILDQTFSSMKSISIDYGIMEPVSQPGDATHLRVLPASIGWNDVGHWGALDEYADKDKHENVIVGNAVAVDTTQSVIHATSATVAVIGLDNIVVVQTEDAILVCPKDRAQDVRQVVEALKAAKRKELL